MDTANASHTHFRIVETEWMLMAFAYCSQRYLDSIVLGDENAHEGLIGKDRARQSKTISDWTVRCHLCPEMPPRLAKLSRDAHASRCN